MTRLFATIALALAVIGLVASFALFARDYGQLPAIVPTHFGVDGNPDAYGPKSTLVLFPVVAVGMFGVFALASVLNLARAKPVPPALPTLLRFVVAETIWLLFFAELGTLNTALGIGGGLGPGFVILLVLTMVTALGMAAYAVGWSIANR